MRIIIGFAKDYTFSRQVYFECDDYYKKNDEKIRILDILKVSETSLFS